jgi:hypothetical protein
MLAIKAVVQSEAVIGALGGHLDLVPFAMKRSNRWRWQRSGRTK